MVAGTIERAKPRASYKEQRQQVVATCLRLEAAGYIVGTYGNVSVRVPGGFIVTPSRVAYAGLRPEDLVLVSMQGEVLDGGRLPSSEMHTHRFIYAARPDIGAIVHTHSLHATAVSCMHATIPVLAEEQAHLVGGEISCTRYVPGINHIELAEEIAGTLGALNSVLLANHGTISCGRDLEEAIVTCQVTERAAQMYMLIRACGRAFPLGAEHVALERDHYLHNYGDAPKHAGDAG